MINDFLNSMRRICPFEQLDQISLDELTSEKVQSFITDRGAKYRAAEAVMAAYLYSKSNLHLDLQLFDNSNDKKIKSIKKPNGHCVLVNINSDNINYALVFLDKLSASLKYNKTLNIVLVQPSILKGEESYLTKTIQYQLYNSIGEINLVYLDVVSVEILKLLKDIVFTILSSRLRFNK